MSDQSDCGNFAQDSSEDNKSPVSVIIIKTLSHSGPGAVEGDNHRHRRASHSWDIVIRTPQYTLRSGLLINSRPTYLLRKYILTIIIKMEGMCGSVWILI